MERGVWVEDVEGKVFVDVRNVNLGEGHCHWISLDLEEAEKLADEIVAVVAEIRSKQKCA